MTLIFSPRAVSHSTDDTTAAPSSSPAKGKCVIRKRKDGTPLIYFDPPLSDGGGWKVTKLDLIPDPPHVYNHHYIITKLEIEFEAQVVIYCKDSNGKFKSVNGTRTKKETRDGLWIAWIASESGVIDFPSIKSLLEGIIEILAEVVKSNLPFPLGFTPADAANIGATVGGARPTKATEGDWKSGKPPKPCQ